MHVVGTLASHRVPGAVILKKTAAFCHGAVAFYNLMVVPILARTEAKGTIFQRVANPIVRVHADDPCEDEVGDHLATEEKAKIRRRRREAESEQSDTDHGELRHVTFPVSALWQNGLRI